MSATAEDRADLITRVKGAAFDTGKNCEHCGGDGRVPGGRRVVHSRSRGIGCDWNVEGIIEAIEKGAAWQWVEGLSGHDLAIEVDPDRWVVFQVRRPTPTTEATP